METLRQVISTDPAPPRRLNPAIARDLETICLKCLRKEPDKRYATAAELAEDLQNWLGNKPIQARRASLLDRTWLWCKRRPAVAGSIAVLSVAAVLVTILIVAQNRINSSKIKSAQITSDQENADSLVRAVLTAPPEGLPYAINALKQYETYTTPMLQTKFNSESIPTHQRLNLALALAKYGNVQETYLIAAIQNCTAEQCNNIVQALRKSETAVKAIESTAIESTANKLSTTEQTAQVYKARLAIVSFYLGDESLAVKMANSDSDPTQRTKLIHVLQTWNCGLNELPTRLAKLEHNLQYSLILGLVDHVCTGLDPATEAWNNALVELRNNSPNNGVHAACDFSLRKAKFPLPSRTESQNRFTNSAGINMLLVPAGKFNRKPTANTPIQTVEVTRPFYIADREITVSQFNQFLSEESEAENAELPVGSVSWGQAIEFCNWLSEKEGLELCYQDEGESRQWIAEANGYRLPTEAEWEYACRANAETEFFIGDDDVLLGAYAVFRAADALPAGSKSPNRLGLFDTAGSICEWCFDSWESDYPDSQKIVDPFGPTRSAYAKYGQHRALRGGHYESTGTTLECSERGRGIPTSKLPNVGFRLAKSK
jgi:sulfatase modifying factor 1